VIILQEFFLACPVNMATGQINGFEKKWFEEGS
jgi:hypothetical protein